MPGQGEEEGTPGPGPIEALRQGGGKPILTPEKQGISSPWQDANANRHGVNIDAKRLI
jgi:hypothetical protein